MARRNAATRNFVGSRFGNHIGCAKQRFERARVSPPAVENAMGERAFAQVHVIDVGDFEFIARTGYGLADFLED